MFKTPYETTVARHSAMNSITSSLAVAFSNQELGYAGISGNVLVLTGLKNSAVRVPPFTHPVVFEDAYKNKQIAIDARSCVAVRNNGGEVINPRNLPEFALLAYRAVTQKCWMAGNYNDIKNISPIIGGIYSRWISETITRQFQLAPDVQLKLAILSAFFYICQFIPKDAFDPKEDLKHAAQVARYTGVSVDFAKNSLEGIGHIEDLKEFSDLVRSLKLSVRLDKFDHAIMLTILTNYWLSNRDREMVAVALEYPPTFVTLVYQAIAERGYQKTRLADLILRNFDKGDNLKQLAMNFKQLVNVWKESQL